MIITTKKKLIICILTMNFWLVHCLTCEEILDLPADQKISKTNLESMLPKDIIKCLSHLGKEEMPNEEAKFVWKSIIKYFDGITNIPDYILGTLRWITPAITPEEYSNITLSNIDVVQNFGLNYNLNEEQLSTLAARVREDFAGKEPEDYTYYDLTAIRQILCAYNRTEIERIPPSSYREAALLIGKLENCSDDAMSGFATLAVQKRAFGPLNDWTADTVNIVGKVASYLPKQFIDKFSIQSSEV